MTDPTEQPTPEQRLARTAGVVSNSEDAIFSVNPSGAITSWNQGAARIYGLRAEAVLGTPAVTLAAPHRALEQRALLDRVLAGERLSRHEIEHRRIDGLPLTVSLTAWPVIADGTVVEASLIAHDLTERKTDQESLAESEARRREIEQLAEIGSWSWDSASGVVQWSAGMHAIARVEPQDYEGTLEAHLAVVHSDDRTAVASALARALREASRFEEEFRIVRRSGEHRWIVGRGEPVLSGDRVVALRGIYQDVTDRRTAERLKDEFLARVSHELRTPLTLIVGFTHLLPRRGSDDDEDDVVVDALARNAKELEQMVVRLLDYAELQVDRKPVAIEALPAREVIERSLVEIRLGNGGHRVVNAVPPDLVVRCDRAAMFRILDNLVGNAAKYAPAGSTIEVSARSDGEWVIVSVADEGPGLPADLRSRAFERFVQGPSQPAARRATGIGLAIVTRTVGLHGGTAWYEDRPSGGAIFSFSLPAG